MKVARVQPPGTLAAARMRSPCGAPGWRYAAIGRGAGALLAFLDDAALVQDGDLHRPGGAENPQEEKRGAPPPVKLMTMHAAKGLEFDAVVVVNDDEPENCNDSRK
mgnify:CR=1 FL=1